MPLDDLLLAGPEHAFPTTTALVDAVHPLADAILAFPGLFTHNLSPDVPVARIVNLTASTTRGAHTRKALVGSVDRALALGADAAAVHVNVSSTHETRMLELLGQAAERCHRYGLPLLAVVYPRSETAIGDDNYEDLATADPDAYAKLVRHCVRVGFELGADIIKTQYTGSSESFRTVVRAAEPVPVVIAGGPFRPAVDVLTALFGALEAGGAGASVGRNVFLRPNVTLLYAMRQLIDGVLSLSAAVETLQADSL